ncbi:hypothetical protein Lal_00038035 [Lupinus albus]|nr:hypothetical protein Lal_00038035 [Lupinus albus]
MEQSRLKGSKHQPLVYEDERSVRLPLGTVVTPTIHSSARNPYGEISRRLFLVKENFDPTEVYKSFLRGPHLYIQGQLTKAGSLSVENRLLHYIIAYILVQRTQITHSLLRSLLPYSIFISRIVDYLRIDVSDTIIVEYTDKDHLYLAIPRGLHHYWSGLSDDDNQDGQIISMLQLRGSLLDQTSELCFGFDQLEAMEQRLNNRMDFTSKD